MTAPLRTARLEHRLTRPNASLAELEDAVGLALAHGLTSLAVSPWLVKAATRGLARSHVRVATVIGFPHGGQVAAVKAFEASTALEDGATQLDFVVNAGALISGDDRAVLDDMLAVVEMAHSALALTGVIVQSGALDDELIRRACRLAARAGVDYVVTSIGGEPVAVAVQSTTFLRRVVGDQLEVKAAGDFTELAGVTAVVAAGADHISTSFSPELAGAASAWLQGRTPATAQPSLADVGAAVG
ncbi:MAG: deoxyribose-phosphate aldolase [Chloroflexota bacterium]|nr:deoxyribose-phosphate aldolase [Chloroflexota bacterium]